MHSDRRWPFTLALRKFVHTMSLRAEVLALDHSARPARTLAMLLVAVLTSLIIGIPVGIVAGDTPLWWREGMPGTLLSGAMILAAAITAWLAHRHQRSVVPWHRSFWALSALALTVLAVVELLQPTQYLGHWLDDSGVRPPGPVHDVDSVIVGAILLTIGMMLAPRIGQLRDHPRTVLLLGVTLACAAASYGVDALWAVGDLEFIIEDGILKATGEPFLVLAYLTAFRDLTTASPVADGKADRGAE